MSQRIFLSYARIDDQKPPSDQAAQGFVSRLADELNFEFKKMPRPWPEVWMDVSAFTDGMLFDEKILEGIADAAVFLPVLSPNWLASPYCQKELELFRQRWAADDPSAFRRRVTVVHSVFTTLHERPVHMQGQVGHRFFSFPAGVEKQNGEQFFYDRGQVHDKAYFATIQRLARELWDKTRAVAPPDAGDPIVRPEVARPDVARPAPPIPAALPEAVRPAASNGRSIYLAKPSLDLELSYQRLGAELIKQGFELRPRLDEPLPADQTSASFIETAMEGCEASVHILGNDVGFAIAGHETSVALQLAVAARKVEETEQAPKTGTKKNAFRRIVWAPKIMPASSSLGRATERDPLTVLCLIDRFLPNDKVDGGVIDDFATFLVQHLDTSRQRDENPPPPNLPGDGSNALSYYIYHKDIDRPLARGVAKALQRPGVKIMLPGLKGDEDEREALHRRYMRECDAIVLCWGGASDTWAKSYSAQFEDWRAFERQEQFKVRGLVVGPPNDEEKEDIDLWADSQIVVIPVSSADHLSPDALRDLGLDV